MPSVRRRRALPRVSRSSEESTAAGIYGVIVGAAVLAASHAESAVAVSIAVLVTLLVSWGAERYARIVTTRIHEGRRPDRRELRSQLTAGWAMVSASALPLATLITARLLGASLATAVLCGFVCSTLLLGIAGREAGRGGELSLRERWVSAAVAAAFGGVLIVLEVMLH